MGEKDLSRGRWVDRHRGGWDRPDIYKGISGQQPEGEEEGEWVW